MPEKRSQPMPRTKPVKAGATQVDTQVYLKAIADSLYSVACSLRELTDTYKAGQVRDRDYAQRRRQPVITHISRATYDKGQREAQEENGADEGVPGFRRE